MKPFTYVLPKTLAEAAAEAKTEASCLKGAGIDLVDRLKERLVTPPQIVNLLPLRRELSTIAAEPDRSLRLGALATLHELGQHPLLAGRALHGLAEAANATGSPQIRNRATIAGNLLQFTRCWYVRSEAFSCLHGGRGPTCLAMTGDNRYHAVLGWSDCVRVHPSNLAPPLLALGAEFSSLLGETVRRRPLSTLFPADPRAANPEHTLEHGEIVTAIHVPEQPEGTRTAYSESRERHAFDWATTACAVRVVLQDGKITAADVVLGAVAPVPLPRPQAARLLVGKEPSDTLFQKVAEAAFAGAVPLTHNGYKLTVGKAVVRDALTRATKV